jgi:glycine/D-amino acid oxidase-like deaminating enzyme
VALPEVVIIGGGIEGCAAAWALTRRGVTDVVIVERDTVGSGGTGKSSGVVRCHYGVSSLAAMANAALEVFENAEEILGADVGFHQTGYVVGVGEQHVRPEASGEILFGNSDLAELEPADPDRYSNQAGEVFLDLSVEKVGSRFPGLENASIASTYAGCYDVTPDFNPVISTTPVDGLVVAAGFSGHGFKISPSVGRLVADLVVDGQSSDPHVPESEFRLSRFADGALMRSPHPYVGAGEMR